MSNEPNPADQTSPGTHVPGDPETTPAGAPVGNPYQAEAAALRSELEETRSRLDLALRAYAESENIRKRLEREKDEAAKYAVTKFARDILGVADNFQRAIATAPDAAAAELDAKVKALVDGIRLTERDLASALERHGVRRLDPQGEPFNPRHHQAVMEMDDPEVAAGTVLQVFQAGYVIEDRILRTAMVAVSKGGARTPRPSVVEAMQPPPVPPAPPAPSATDPATAGDAQRDASADEGLAGFGRRASPPPGPHS